MSDHGHYQDELQDLLDRRLDLEQEKQVRSHLDGCPECRREFEALAWVKGLSGSAGHAEPPAGLEDSIRGALDTEERRQRSSRRAFLAAAAGILLSVGGAVWLIRRRSGGGIPGAVARDYRLFRSGGLPLEIQTASGAEVETFFRERGVAFRTRVLDLAMMSYRIQGGAVHRIDGEPSALFAYRGEGGKLLVCQMYPGRLEHLPGAEEVRTHRGFRFQIYRADSVTLVFWQEGEVVCVLAGDFGREEVIALALEKAML
jgi:anti-sigma factor RsiW